MKNEIAKIQPALEFKKVREISDFKRQLFDLIKASYFLSGIKTPKEEDISLMTEALNDIIVKKYGFLEFEEISQSIKDGSIGLKGDFMGLNVKSYVGFINKYLGSKERLKYVEQKKEAAMRRLPEPKKIEVDKKEAWKKALERFKDSGQSKVIGATYIFDLAKSLGKFKGMSKQETDTLWKESKSLAHQHYQTIKENSVNVAEKRKAFENLGSKSTVSEKAKELILIDLMREELM